MSMITDPSFWKEQATASRGWKRSTMCASTSSAVRSSRSGGGATAIRSVSDGAFAFAANDLVDVRALPIDEEVHVLQVELDGQREVLHQVREPLRTHALGEVGEA